MLATNGSEVLCIAKLHHTWKFYVRFFSTSHSLAPLPAPVQLNAFPSEESFFLLLILMPEAPLNFTAHATLLLRVWTEWHACHQRAGKHLQSRTIIVSEGHGIIQVMYSLALCCGCSGCTGEHCLWLDYVPYPKRVGLMIHVKWDYKIQAENCQPSLVLSHCTGITFSNVWQLHSKSDLIFWKCEADIMAAAGW